MAAASGHVASGDGGASLFAPDLTIWKTSRPVERDSGLPDAQPIRFGGPKPIGEGRLGGVKRPFRCRAWRSPNWPPRKRGTPATHSELAWVEPILMSFSCRAAGDRSPSAKRLVMSLDGYTR